MIKKDMERRKPGKDKLSTTRKEEDEFEIVSGELDGYTTGAPLCVLIKNSDTHSSDYSSLKDIPRPSHSDYSAYLKYDGYNDIRGGGHFSGRLTAPIVCLGSICKQILLKENIKIYGHILKIGNVKDKSLLEVNYEELNEGLYISDIKDKVENIIEKAREAKDSIGATVECGVYNMKKGVGGPLFDGLEGKLATLLYGIPAVKAVEFGLGSDFSNSYGSEVNDCYEIKDGEVKLKSNNNGGITGGITNGEPIIVKATFKPTPSISREQDSVNLKKMENEKLVIKGRHDPVVALRAVPVMENILAFGILDSIL
jgi:chorismate synthase